MNIKNNQVNRAAQNDLESLLSFLDQLKKDQPAERSSKTQGATSSSYLPASIEPKKKNSAYEKLKKEFVKVVEQYGRVMSLAIENEGQARKRLHNQQLAYYFDQGLSQVSAHVQLLAELAAADSQDRLEFSDLLELIIAGIFTRFKETPVFFPLFSSEFKYVHFNYMDNVAVIGIPLSVWARPTWSLGVLWHEVGGYAVARARRSGKFQQWTNELAETLRGQDRKSPFWPYYRGLYEASRLQNVNVELKVYDDYCRVIKSREIRRYFRKTYRTSHLNIDNDSRWQIAWLGEFFEDLFGVQALGETMLEVLADIFMRRYKNVYLGDAHHPPPNLRLQVILCYLDEIYKDETKCKEIQDILTKIKARYEWLRDLSFGKLNSNDKLGQTAKIIASIYLKHINDFSSGTIHKQEKEVAKLVLNIHRSLFSKTESYRGAEYQQRLNKELKEAHDQLGKFNVNLQPVDLVPSQYVWESAGLDLNDLENISLESFLSVQFTDTDETPGRGTPAPFP